MNWLQTSNSALAVSGTKLLTVEFQTLDECERVTNKMKKKLYSKTLLFIFTLISSFKNGQGKNASIVSTIDNLLNANNIPGYGLLLLLNKYLK